MILKPSKRLYFKNHPRNHLILLKPSRSTRIILAIPGSFWRPPCYGTVHGICHGRLNQVTVRSIRPVQSTRVLTAGLDQCNVHVLRTLIFSEGWLKPTHEKNECIWMFGFSFQQDKSHCEFLWMGVQQWNQQLKKQNCEISTISWLKSWKDKCRPRNKWFPAVSDFAP